MIRSGGFSEVDAMPAPTSGRGKWSWFKQVWNLGSRVAKVWGLKKGLIENDFMTNCTRITPVIATSTIATPL